MKVVQYIYAFILNGFYKSTSKISLATRERIVQLLLGYYAVWIILIKYSAEKAETEIIANTTPVVCGIVIFLIAVFSVTKPVRVVRWNTPVCFFYYVTGILMLLSWFLHKNEGAATTYTIYMFEWLFLFPMLYYVWNSRGDYADLFEKIARAFCYVGFAYLIVLICLFPVGASNKNGLYIGTTSNPNTLALLVSAFVIAGIYMFITSRSKLIPLITVCLGTGIVMLCQSRTVLLAITLAILAALVFTIFSFVKKRDSFYLQRIVLLTTCIAVIILMAPLVSHLFNFVNTAFAETSLIMDKFNKGDTLNAKSSGRINLWIHCLKESTLLGNSTAEDICIGDTVFHGTHNNIVEIIYRYGFLAGISYIGLWISTARAGVKVYINSTYKEGIFVIMVLVAFFVIGMLEIAFKPYGYGITFINIFVFCIIFVKR